MYSLAASFAFGSLGSWLTAVGADSSLSAVNYSPSLQTFAHRPTNSRRRLPGSARIVALPCTFRKDSRPFNSRGSANSSILLNNSLSQLDAATCVRTPHHSCALFEVSIGPASIASSPRLLQQRNSVSSASSWSAVPLLSVLVYSSSYYRTTLVAPYSARPASGFLQVSLSKVPRHLRCRVSPTVLAESLPINANDYTGVYCGRGRLVRGTLVLSSRQRTSGVL